MIASKPQKRVENSVQQKEDVDIFAGLTLPAVPSHNIVVNHSSQTAIDLAINTDSQNINSQIQKSSLEVISNANNSENTQQNLNTQLEETLLVDDFAIFSSSVKEITSSKLGSNTSENEVSADTISNLPTQLSKLYTTVEDGHYSQSSNPYPVIPSLDGTKRPISLSSSSTTTSATSSAILTTSISNQMNNNLVHTEEIIRNMNNLSTEINGIYYNE